MSEINQPTLATLINDKVDLQTALDKLVCVFARKYYPHRISLEVRYVNGDAQVTVSVVI
jgi:hypothetical protein